MFEFLRKLRSGGKSLEQSVGRPLELENGQAPGLLSATLFAVSFAVVAAIVWASIAEVHEVAAARGEIDRVLDSAERHPVAIGEVTTLAEARTTVLLDEIVTLVSGDERLIDPRVRRLREHEPALAQTLQTYLDSFGDVGAAAGALHVHPNTVRYRIRRVEKLMATSLDDPDVRLLLALSLRATA